MIERDKSILLLGVCFLRLLFDHTLHKTVNLNVAGKLITHNVNFVLCVYILDLAMVAADFTLTLRNRKLDALSAKGSL